MEQILINLVAGALGGVGAGKSSPTFDLGTIGNIVSGLVGGGALGQIVTLLLPSVMAAAQSGDLSIGGIVSQAIAGGAGGARGHTHGACWCNQEQSRCLTVNRQTRKFSVTQNESRAGRSFCCRAHEHGSCGERRDC